MILWELFLTFAKVGLFTFGGGYAMIALIEEQCVEKKQWITHDDMMNITVIAESTPGPIAINCATFVGWKQAKLPGAVLATLGMVLPSFVIIYLISLYFDNFLALTAAANAFRGIKIAVGFLILDAAAGMLKKMQKKPLPRGIMAASCAVILAVNFLGLRFSSVTLMLLCACLSMAVFAVKGGKGGESR